MSDYWSVTLLREDVLIDISLIVGLADKLGALQAVKGKLLQQPDETELAKMVVAGRSVLLGMEAGQSMVGMGEARGHCHRISKIYNKYLKRWFHDVLDQNKAQQLNFLLNALNTADSAILEAMKSSPAG